LSSSRFHWDRAPRRTPARGSAGGSPVPFLPGWSLAEASLVKNSETP